MSAPKGWAPKRAHQKPELLDQKQGNRNKEANLFPNTHTPARLPLREVIRHSEQRLNKWWRQMRVESSRDVYASAESAVVFLARAENGRKSSGRGAEEIFPDSQKSLFARWNGSELPTFMLVPLLISGEFSAKEFFSCLPTIYKCKWIHQRAWVWNGTILRKDTQKYSYFHFAPARDIS